MTNKYAPKWLPKIKSDVLIESINEAKKKTAKDYTVKHWGGQDYAVFAKGKSKPIATGFDSEREALDFIDTMLVEEVNYSKLSDKILLKLMTSATGTKQKAIEAEMAKRG